MTTNNSWNSEDPAQVAKGGTGNSTLTDGSILLGSGTAAVTPLAVGATGEGLMANTAADPSWDASPTYSGIITGEEIHATNIQDQTFSGFLEFTGAGSIYTVAGTTFTLDRPGAGYIKGIKYTWAGGQNTGALAAGNLYWVYIDDTGTLQSVNHRSGSLFKDYIVLFEVLVDNASNVMVVKENHPYTFPVESSNWAHDVVGTVIANEHQGANIVLNGTKGIEISGADELEDHGLETDIPDSGGAAVTFSLMYTDGAGKWVRNASQNTFPSDYNNGGAVGALGGNKYGIFRLYVSKDDIETSTPTYYAVYDTSQYNNLVAAQTAVSNNSVAVATNELFGLEMAQLGFVIKEESSDNIVDVIIEKSVAGTSSTVASTSVASLITTNVTNFDGWLSAADTTVQSALETLDDQGKNVTPQHALLVAGAGYDISTLALGANKQILVGNTGGDPQFNASPTVTELTSDTNVNAATFDTNVAAAGVTLSGTTLSADGTDANIPITITPKGGEAITIDGLDYPMADGNAGEVMVTSGGGVLSLGVATVPGGGTGAATLTNHGVLVGSAAAAVTPLAVGTTGELLVGVTASDPAFGASANGDFTFTSSTAGSTRTLTVTNTDNSNAASHAEILAESGGASGGDAFLRVSVSGAQDYSFGVENSGSDDLVITDDATPSAGNELWNMNASGMRTMPLQPCFLANHSTTQTDVTGDGTNYTVLFDTEVTDQNGDFAANTFTAPVAGTYCFYCGVELINLTSSETALDGVIATSNRAYPIIGGNPWAMSMPYLTRYAYNGEASCDMDAGDTCIINTAVSNGAKVVDIRGNDTVNNIVYFGGHLQV